MNSTPVNGNKAADVCVEAMLLVVSVQSVSLCVGHVLLAERYVGR